MTIPAWFFALTSALFAYLWLRERQNARRRYGRLLCEHKTELALHGLSSFRRGLRAERERQERKEQPAQEAAQ